MSETEGPIRVFVSYSRRDRAMIERLVYALKSPGIQYWWDEQLVPGEFWTDAIETELRACSVFLACVGPHGVGKWQKTEIQIAVNRQIAEGTVRIIPVLLPEGWKNSKQLPDHLSLNQQLEYSRSIDGESSVTARLLAAIRGEQVAETEGSVPLEQSPYPGLSNFDGKDQQFFRGRDKEISLLVDKLQQAVTTEPSGSQPLRFVAVVGASGSGKSSLVRAGLLARLMRGALPGSSDWPVLKFRPAEISIDPLQNLAVALMSDARLVPRGATLVGMMEELGKRSDAMHLHLATTLLGRPDDYRVVIFIDQFEEIFTLCTELDSRRQFLDNLMYACSVPRGRVVVIVTFRADLYANCASHPQLAEAMSGNQVLLGPMKEQELWDVIQWPARQTNCEIESGLVELLVTAVRDEPNALPLLQFTLAELWKQGGGRKLTLENYHKMGELKGALNREAERIYQAFSPVQQQCCEKMLLLLVKTGEGHDYRRRAARNELVGASGDEATALFVLDRLARSRLITFDGDLDAVGGDGFVEITHEALIRGWERLLAWINDKRDAMRIRDRLTEASAEWRKHKQNVDFLYHGSRLAEAVNWKRQLEESLTPEIDEFLAASLRDRRLRKLRVAASNGILILAAAFAIGLVWYFSRESKARSLAVTRTEERVAGDVMGMRGLAEQIAPYQDSALQWVDAELQKSADGADPRRLLNLHLCRLILAPGGAGDASLNSHSLDFARQASLSAPSEDLPALCEILAASQADLVSDFWIEIAPGKSFSKSEAALNESPAGREALRRRRIRAAAILATFDASNSQWESCADALLRDLLEEPDVADLTQWLAMLRPVNAKLFPPLHARFTGTIPFPETQRQRLTDVASSVIAGDAVGLARLLVEAEPEAYVKLFDRADLRISPQVVAILEQAIEAVRPEAAKPRADHERDAKRRVNAAVALVRLGQAGPGVWRLLDRRPDNGPRSYLIHRLAELGADPASLLAQWTTLASAPDRSAARALLLALGEFSLTSLKETPQLQSFLGELQVLYEKDPDPGLHSAIEWLFRRWGISDRLAATEKSLIAKYQNLSSTDSRRGFLAERRGWYVDSLGNTLAIIEAPGVVAIGSPPREITENAIGEGRETRHRRRIPRRYAIGVKEIRVETFRRFVESLPAAERTSVDLVHDTNYSPTDDHPMNSLSWYVATRFCNWLSKQEGLTPGEFCYQPDGPFGAGMVPRPNYLSLPGYRLPTEAEWEHACRAGSETSRFYGDSEVLLDRYARSVTANPRDRQTGNPVGLHMHPVGTLKPNDFGLFDTLGNCDEWCQERFVSWKGRSEAGVPIDDVEELSTVGIDNDQRVARGGSMVARAVYLRCANRYTISPDSSKAQNRNCIGLRVVRTLPPAAPEPR